VLRARLGDIDLQPLAYGDVIAHQGVRISLHPAGHVLNHDSGDLGGAPKAPDGLENLQLHQQCHLGRRRSRTVVMTVVGASRNILLK
jgi:hypothetical protein